MEEGVPITVTTMENNGTMLRDIKQVRIMIIRQFTSEKSKHLKGHSVPPVGDITFLDHK